MSRTLDRTLLGIVIILVAGGFLVFSSASLGLLAREGARFSSVAASQLLYGIGGGTLALILGRSIPYRLWRKYAFFFMLAAVGLTALTLVPGIGLTLQGASRWLKLGFITLQPAEFLKIASVIYLSAWLTDRRRKIGTIWHGALPFVALLLLIGGVVLLQPDTDTFVIMALAGAALFITAGGRWRDALLLCLGGAILLAALAYTRPYVKERLTSFINPARDPQGASYQVNQSLIAIGSGGVFGRGFGQSIQKFEHLPEPISDSIFAVYSEEFGFAGSALLVLLFSFFALVGYKIAAGAPDRFGMFLAIGLTTLIVAQAYLNIAAMLGLVPLSGLPLPFISHGGTALLSALGAVGVILNVARPHGKKTPLK